MGLFRWLFQWLAGRRKAAEPARSTTRRSSSSHPSQGTRAKLKTLRAGLRAAIPKSQPPIVDLPPYRFANYVSRPRFGGLSGRAIEKGYLDLSTDVDQDRLGRYDLPPLATPDDIADWLGVPIGKVAWLAGRSRLGQQPPAAKQSHYVFRWQAKRSGGARLIESPKPLLREVQTRILREILDRAPLHPTAHGFAKGRSILTNATPHCGRAVVIKWDLANFYVTVRFNRVVAIFRSLGYSREAAVWLASLTTSAAPSDLPIPESGAHAIRPYVTRHLPQGAPTSPALANLSAFSLDVRLSGLARAFDGVYTRYADDLTISGDGHVLRNLRNLIPLVEQVIRSERFQVHPTKRRVLRRGQRQTVAGVVVNEKPNVRRGEFDRLKALLHNAIRHGARSQNRDGHPDFAAHLRGRIAHISMVNPARGAKLASLYDQIDFH